ncbi:TetR/AcrR family transcriptional regulator [Ruania rhizosphaerae]|uniref:TetR/AcrR family transcriptional regulator n=1 Tax=Ruania rhizosphaerae TaxID=1840413 RepID=UPI0013592BA3|nr:TetR/AcrR family transcriptional regulator [Ruania rhizosphaerae]
MPRANLNEHTVLEAAAGLADREGFAAVTVSAVARLLGVQPASLYEHVRGREALLDGIQRLALGELSSRISAGVAGCAGSEALRGLADAHRAYSRERPGAWAAIERRASAQTAQSPEAGRVASLTLAVVRGYPVPSDALIHAARLIGATINGFLTLSRVDAFGHRSEAEEESWTVTIDALDRALHTWPAKGVRS